ncbi:Hypothetical predicted protein [Paramuricea clavata]|uniref:Uncharacterized protein n=1 Tax=Paramuricea clavata TaxID=317549 RepID=A0A6S7IE15_PARCT|nr:Hypothetical predicted protein [Paramuricea clavata]
MVENPEAQTVANEEEEREAIESYFLAGYRYETILCFLSKYHSINHSMSTLKRRLREYGLKRENAVDIDDNDIVEAIQQELQGPSCLSGYRKHSGGEDQLIPILQTQVDDVVSHYLITFSE